MGTEKRDRQKASRQARLDQARAEEARRKRNRTVRNASLFVALVVVIALVIAQPWQSDDDDDNEVAVDDTTTTTTSEEPYGTGACPAEDGSSPPTLTFEDAPQLCIDPAAAYTAEIETTEGTVVVELDAEAAPVTVNNFVTLARYGYYDDVAFHRIIQGFVNQTGDPTGEPPGTGNPGYAIIDELPASADAYIPGSLAMANSGAGTSGGQFFVVVGDGGDQLQPLYSLFGQVVEGQEVMDAVNADFGEAPGGAGTPTGDVRIVSVTITEGAGAGGGTDEDDQDGDDTTTTAPGDTTAPSAVDEDDDTTTTAGDADEPTTTVAEDGDEPTTTTSG